MRQLVNDVYFHAVDLKTKNGLGPLHLASTHGQVDVLSILLSARADVNQRTQLNQNTALHYASNHSTIELLLRHKANPTSTNTNGDTALMWVATSGAPDCLRALLTAGALPDAQNEEGVSVLACAIDQGSPEAVQTILSALTDGGGSNSSSNSGLGSDVKDVGGDVEKEEDCVETILTSTIRKQLKLALQTVIQRNLVYSFFNFSFSFFLVFHLGFLYFIFSDSSDSPNNPNTI